MNLKQTIGNGATLNSNNLTNAILEKGYMVSKKAYEFILPASATNETIYEVVDEIRQHITRKNEYVGVWLDDGKYYIDLSVNIKSLKKAKEFGKKENQLAIYDIENDTVIRL